jgi:hypothetical protein
MTGSGWPPLVGALADGASRYWECRPCATWADHRFVTQYACDCGHALVCCRHCCEVGFVFDATDDEVSLIRSAARPLHWLEPWRVTRDTDRVSSLFQSHIRLIPDRN